MRSMTPLLAANMLLSISVLTVNGQSVSGGQVLASRLTDGQAIFGIFSGEKTAEQGACVAGYADLDFVFYSLERGPFDLPQMQLYMDGMGNAGRTHPVVLRIPPIRDDRQGAHVRAGLGIDAGAVGLVFPHVESREDAEFAVAAVRTKGPSWPDAGAELLSMLLIEDQVGIDNVREIVGTAGVSMVSPGPGDLRQVYSGDAEKVETAIQTVLAACKEFGVPCGITAGVDDIAERITQGFRVIILTDSQALAVGRRAAGRTN
ncbi:MAG: aldolase/citrate lyase family protein [Acidobacteriota bacterium]|nr:aldolase/citrate lyase family protein [Acidobacteriota bacterium]